jgi:YVTN family beta-propeller protein
MKKILTTFFLFYYLFTTAYGQVLSKVYVLSEGGFSPNSSSLSMLNTISNTFIPNIFNPGSLGLYPDGLIFHNDNLFLTEQGNYGSAGKIYRLDTLGTVISSAVVGTNPYSLAIANNKIYITNGPSSNVSVLNLNNLSLIKNITVGVYPQEIIALGNKVFVANNSLFGGNSDSTVSVIDATRDSVVHRIIVKKDPSSLAITNDNHLLIGCPGNASKGIIYKVNPNNYQIVDSFFVQTYGFGKDISVDKRSNKIFFISDLNNIVSLDLVTRTVNSLIASNFPSNYFYGYGFDYVNRRHYILDAKNFTVTGSLLIADSLGQVLTTYQTGIAPRRVLFKYVAPSSYDENIQIVDDFILHQNFPNPFNPNTVISWESPSPSWQTIKVYDILGNEIATLIDEPKTAGYHSVVFDGSKLPSGTYFYTLKSGNYIKMKKMTLIK